MDRARLRPRRLGRRASPCRVSAPKRDHGRSRRASRGSEWRRDRWRHRHDCVCGDRLSSDRAVGRRRALLVSAGPTGSLPHRGGGPRLRARPAIRHGSAGPRRDRRADPADCGPHVIGECVRRAAGAQHAQSQHDDHLQRRRDRALAESGRRPHVPRATGGRRVDEHRRLRQRFRRQPERLREFPGQRPAGHVQRLHRRWTRNQRSDDQPEQRVVDQPRPRSQLDRRSHGEYDVVPRGSGAIRRVPGQLRHQVRDEHVPRQRV